MRDDKRQWACQKLLASRNRAMRIGLNCSESARQPFPRSAYIISVLEIQPKLFTGGKEFSQPYRHCCRNGASATQNIVDGGRRDVELLRQCSSRQIEWLEVLLPQNLAGMYSPLWIPFSG